MFTHRYNFQPIQRYKALSAEEAEQEFSRRNKVMNYFSLMLRKRLRNDEDGGDEEELVEGSKNKRLGKKDKDLKISDMDEWMDSDDDELGSDEEEIKKRSDDENDPKKKNKSKGKNNYLNLLYEYNIVSIKEYNISFIFFNQFKYKRKRRKRMLLTKKHLKKVMMEMKREENVITFLILQILNQS